MSTEEQLLKKSLLRAGKVIDQLREDNERLRASNAALVRAIERLLRSDVCSYFDDVPSVVASKIHEDGDCAACLSVVQARAALADAQKENPTK